MIMFFLKEQIAISRACTIWSSQEADLVTTHELGHNFGAEHDPDNIPYCAPREDQGGKYIMYPIAVSGDHSNNKVTLCPFHPKTASTGPDVHYLCAVCVKCRIVMYT